MHDSRRVASKSKPGSLENKLAVAVANHQSMLEARAKLAAKIERKRTAIARLKWLLEMEHNDIGMVDEPSDSD